MARWPGCQVSRWPKLLLNLSTITSSSDDPGSLLMKELISRVTENCCMLEVLRVTWEEGGRRKSGNSSK